MEQLRERRERNWRQDGVGRLETSADAIPFIQEVGMATLYGASSEVPSLYQAHMGDPNPPTFATWDSPAGFVYTWRWELGRPHIAWYGTLVAKKPTWVTFDLLPSVLGALAERRTPQELYEAGELSDDSRRVALAFVGTDGVLSTAQLRDRAGFPKGKESRAAYLKAVEELDLKLFLAKRFLGDGEEDTEMSHAWVPTHYGEAWDAGLSLDPEAALATVLDRLLRTAAYLDPKPLSRHLRVSPARLDTAFGRLADEGKASRFEKLWITYLEKPV